MVVVALDCEETKHILYYCDIGCDWLPVVVTLDVTGCLQCCDTGCDCCNTGCDWLPAVVTLDGIGCLLQTSMLQSIERYMKQAIVDKVPGVSSAAPVSYTHLTLPTSVYV